MNTLDAKYFNLTGTSANKQTDLMQSVGSFKENASNLHSIKNRNVS